MRNLNMEMSNTSKNILAQLGSKEEIYVVYMEMKRYIESDQTDNEEKRLDQVKKEQMKPD